MVLCAPWGSDLATLHASIFPKWSGFTKRQWSCYQSPELDTDMVKGLMATTFFTNETSPGNPDSKI